jgi:hypothetical protein
MKGKYAAFVSRIRNKRVRVVLVEDCYEIVFDTVDGDNSPRSLNIPLKSIGNRMVFKLSKNGAINLTEKLSEALSYQFSKYFNELRKRRDEDGYEYTDEVLSKNIEYIKQSWVNDLSVYKCLEFMYDEIAVNEQKAEASKKG